jgi:hypothetical protein
MTSFRFALSALLLAALAGCGSAVTEPPLSPDGLEPVGTWVVREDQVMRLATGAAGRGTLLFQSWQYNFTFQDAKITVSGAEGAEISGAVYNLKNVRDFEGRYTPRPEFDAADKLKGFWASNDKGVIIYLRQMVDSVAVDLKAKGALVTLVEQ